MGLTHVLDGGWPPRHVQAVLETASDSVDLWKLGWGTAYVDAGVDRKLAALDGHGVRACTGGTLLEVAWAQDAVEAFLDWAAGLGFACVEVSNGAVAMPGAAKRRLITRAAERFEVVAEVGSKDPRNPVSAAAWAEEAAADLAAGAARVVAEGRESGTVGLYRSDGRVREDVVHALVDAVGVDRVVFWAPGKPQQAWFIRRFGPDVNLANVAVGDLLGLEALRLGLRADTVDLLAADPLPDRG